MTESAYPDEILPEEPEEPEEGPYRFIRIPNLDTYLLGETQVCSYEDASFLRGMARADVERIERDRERLFEGKLRLLEILTESVGPDDLVERCLAVLANDFNADEMRYYLGLDEFYLGGKVHLGTNENWNPKMSPGGFTNLFEVLGRVVAERQLGTFRRLNEISSGIIAEALRLPSDYDFAPRWHYFKFLVHTDRRTIDAAIDELPSLLNKERNFWENLERELRARLENRFRAVVPIELKPEYLEMMLTILKYTASTLEAKLAQGQLLVPMPEAQEEESIFRRRPGGDWEIKFKNEPLHVFNDLDGLFYVHLMMSSSEKSFTPSELRVARYRDKGGSRSGIVIQEFSANGNASALKDGGDMTDVQSLQSYKEELEDMERFLRQAKFNNDEAEVQRLETERFGLIKHIREVTGLGGKPAKFSRKTKNDRDAVLKAITTAEEKISKTSSALAIHLRNSLHKNDLLQYKPESAIDWRL
jgi:hypothetical protein